MTALSCSREGCPVSQTGRCLEGFEPLKCPYASEAAATDAEPPSRSEFVKLPHGLALNSEEAADITRADRTKVIVVAGPVASGKTTLLTSMYEGFLEAPFGNCLFAGSRTMLGFEQRCHEARQESGNTLPMTAHTTRASGVEFLHLRLDVRINTSVGRQSLLISDISGEQFSSLRDSSAAVASMTALSRADHLCLVIDGGKLVDPIERHSVRNDARLLLRAIRESKLLRSECGIQVVFSKWDVVIGAADGALLEFIEQIKASLGSDGHVAFFEVAARPTNTRLPFAHGLPPLMNDWLADPQPKNEINFLKLNQNSREINRFSQSMEPQITQGGMQHVNRL